MADVHSYYNQPIIKEPVWTWEIPFYFYTGGMAGASAGLAYLCQQGGNDPLARRAWAVSLGAVSLSPVLLISDLGKPLRFLNMLRMFKVTSPMSVGSWILSASGLTTGLAAANAWAGLFPRAGRAAKPAAAILGLPLSTYTGALIANTAVPLWHEARHELPFVFGAGAALSAGAATAMVAPPEVAAPARRLAIGAAVAELVLEAVMERRLGALGEPYRHGTPHRMTWVSRATIAVGTVLLGWRGARERRWARIAGALMNAGALSTRWSIFRAGFGSVADPKYVVGQQRGNIDSGRRSGAARRQATVAAPDGARASPATSLGRS